ncbi:MAG: hypothetical protein AAF557_23700 [Pseudomonadota bacterium]
MRIILALILAVAAAIPAAAEDKRVGYYYPAVTSEETFVRSLGNTPPANRAVRANFITEITKAQLEGSNDPKFVVFAKGAAAEHMIILAVNDEVFRTLYRARAVMAQLTANARGTEFFKSNNLQFVATWFDLAKLLGFEDIVVSDGVTWSHRIILE